MRTRLPKRRMRPTPTDPPRRSLLRHAVASAASATLNALTPVVDPLRGTEHIVLLRLAGRSYDALLGRRSSRDHPLGWPLASGTTDEVMTAPAADDPAAATVGFDAAMLPVLSRLAREFATFEAWYSDGTDPALGAIRASGAASVFYPDEQGASVIALEHPELVERADFAPMTQFHHRIRAGELARLSVIEPRSLFAPADLATFALTGRDRSADLRHAERLIHEVYTAVRAVSPNVALLVLGTDGGGGRDPRERVLADGAVRTRVPAVLVSAFARTGAVVPEEVDHRLLDAIVRERRDAATDRILLAALDPSSYRLPANWPATTPAWTPRAAPTELPPDARLRAATERASSILGTDEALPESEAEAVALVRAAGARLHPQ